MTCSGSCIVVVVVAAAVAARLHVSNGDSTITTTTQNPKITWSSLYAYTIMQRNINYSVPVIPHVCCGGLTRLSSLVS